MKTYNTEREGQLAFFKNIGINAEQALIENTDGVWNGNLLEFKLSISDTNKVLFQCVKYLSKLRISGTSVPRNIVMIDLNRYTAYIYDAQNFYEEIHKIYSGSASIANDGFDSKGVQPRKLEYLNSTDMDELKRVLKQTEYVKIRIDENCIVGWAERYYRENPTASKADFLGDDGEFSHEGEIRNPVKFRDFIVPYEGETNEKFKYLMDKLNDRLKKKKLGAFYTPEAYAKKAHELLQLAIARVPEGNDYVIIDRCAGTGNLEAVFTDEELSHCILSTYEYFEYKVLFERLGDKVRHIVPPTEQNIEFSSGLIVNADAMSKEFIDNEVIRRYIDDPKVTVIMYENPPYQDSSAITFNDENGERQKTGRKESYVVKRMSETKKFGIQTREISNNFIWSAFEYYLHKPEDSYIVFSPMKYWKSVGLAEKEFVDGFIFNRKYFHANASTVGCILWGNRVAHNETLILPAFDIKDDELLYVRDIKTSIGHKGFEPFYDKRISSQDIKTTVCCESNGMESKKACYKKIRCGNDIIAYLRAFSFGIDPKNYSLTTAISKNALGGFYVRKDNYLTKLPLFCAKMFPSDDWFEIDIYFNTSDGGDRYTKDRDFLKSCLIYTCLSRYNKCLSFDGSDGRFYRNELCFHKDAVAMNDLVKFKLDDEEKKLLDVWNRVLEKAAATGKMVEKFTYGPYQIEQEINTFHKDETGKKNIYDYPELNAELNTLKTLLKTYYKTHIREKMFEYELVK